MAKYVSTSELTPYKVLFDNAFRMVQSEARKSGLTFEHHLVGSAKRNLVVEHPNKGFDCDYQLYLQKNTQNLSAQQIKELLMDLFDKYIPDSFNKCENSTSSITISKVNPTESKKEFTYDVVILKDVDSIPQILKVVKQGNSLMYQWNKLPEMKHFIERFKLIQGPQMWDDLRECYYKKKMDKINGVRYHDKKSFQIFHEAVNETLQKFHI